MEILKTQGPEACKQAVSQEGVSSLYKFGIDLATSGRSEDALTL